MRSMTLPDQIEKKSLLFEIYTVALPLIFTASLGNILEVVDLSISSFIDLEIVKSISFLERFRFVYGAILIAFTSTLNMYLNRTLPKGEFGRARKIFETIKDITLKLGFILSLTFMIGIYFLSSKGSPTWIYGLGTGVNIFIMFLSTPWYMALISSKKTKNILKVTLLATAFNIFATWFLAKEMGWGTTGVILPTILANLMTWLLLRNEAQQIEFMEAKSTVDNELKGIWEFSKNNLKGNLSVCLSELALVVLALQLGEVGILYGIFFALDKLFNGITQAVSNSAGIQFGHHISRSGIDAEIKPFTVIGVGNATLVTVLSIISLTFYNKFIDLQAYIVPIIALVFFKSLNTFFQKGILRQGGDVKWIKHLNVWFSSLSKFVIAGALIPIAFYNLPSGLLFWLLMVQSMVVTYLILRRIQSREWFHEV